MSIALVKISIFIIVLIILGAWVGIEKLIERRELKELIEKKSGKKKKEN